MISNASPETCNCNSGFIWNSLTLSCLELPTINCANITFTDNTTAVNRVCVCITGFVWDSIAYVCRINCSLFTNANFTASADTFDYCICNSNYYWNA